MSEMVDKFNWKPHWRIEKYADDDAFARGETFEVSEFDGNVLLNAGIQLMLDLLIGAGGTVLSNANAYIGVGDSNAGEDAAHTGLQAATNKLWKAMDSTWPQRTNQTMAWKSTFGSSDANYSWQEFTVVNASSDTGVNLNRKISNQGTKTTGQTWVVTLNVTIS